MFYYAYKAVQDNEAWLLQQLIFRSKYAQATHKIIFTSSPPPCTYWVYERYYPAILINKKNHMCWRSRWKMRIGKLSFLLTFLCAPHDTGWEWKMLYKAEKDISFHARKRNFQWYRANSRAWLLKHIYDIYITHTSCQKYYQKVVYQKVLSKISNNIITFSFFLSQDITSWGAYMCMYMHGAFEKNILAECR